MLKNVAFAVLTPLIEHAPPAISLTWTPVDRFSGFSWPFRLTVGLNIEDPRVFDPRRERSIAGLQDAPGDHQPQANWVQPEFPPARAAMTSTSAKSGCTNVTTP